MIDIMQNILGYVYWIINLCCGNIFPVFYFYTIYKLVRSNEPTVHT